jgi:hypothetical protein
MRLAFHAAATEPTSIVVEIYGALDFKGPAEAPAVADGFTMEKQKENAF